MVIKVRCLNTKKTAYVKNIIFFYKMKKIAELILFGSVKFRGHVIVLRFQDSKKCR